VIRALIAAVLAAPALAFAQAPYGERREVQVFIQ